MSRGLVFGSVFAATLAGASSVALGAFGAHALRDMLDERSLAAWRTAVDYQLWHALALLATGLLARDRPSSPLRVAVVAFALGIVLFCGSLYALALGAPRALGAVTPLGGIAFIAGWIALGAHGWRAFPATDDSP
jgi:uncharacterized membrane protein YgdD (TMEM256/DUF423 family)